MCLLKVHKGEDPYMMIGKYIQDNTKIIGDMIAVIEIDGEITKELMLFDFEEDGFEWLNDWWEGEDKVTLIDFFLVSEATKILSQ